MSWGALPKDTPVPWWSARAIFHAPDGIDLVHDRIDHEGDKAEVKALCKWLDTKGLKMLKEQLRKEGVQGSEFHEVRIEGDGHVLIANPRKSYGYLYLGAWKGC
jgi:hypothetical protein